MDKEVYLDSAGRTIVRPKQEKAPKPEVENTYHFLRSKEDSGVSSEEMRRQLGTEMQYFVKSVFVDQPDVLVFLDKSARPAYWFFDAMWNELYPSHAHPEIKFINIGSEKAPNANQEFEMMFDRESFKAHVRANEKQVNKVREHFLEGKKSAKNASQKDSLSYLDNKNIWIVDEHSSTGATLLTAQALIEAATRSRHYDGIEAISLFSHEPPWLSLNKEFDVDALGVRERKPGDFAVIPIMPVPHEVRQLKHELSMLAQETARNKIR